MVELVSLTSLARILYLISLAIVIGVGGYYADYLRVNDISRDNEAAVISLVIFAIILFVISLRNISNYIFEGGWLLPGLFFMGLASSFALTVYFYYQDKVVIDDDYKVYFYVTLVAAALAILLMLILVYTDKSFQSIGRNYVSMDAKTIAINQTKERLEKLIPKEKDEDILQIYKGMLNEIKNVNEKNIDNTLIRCSYFYGKENYVTNILLSNCVIAGDRKTRFSYKEAFDKLSELKTVNNKRIKLKNFNVNKDQEYTYDELITRYQNDVSSTKNYAQLDGAARFSSTYKKDMLDHLPVVHNPDQPII